MPVENGRRFKLKSAVWWPVLVEGLKTLGFLQNLFFKIRINDSQKEAFWQFNFMFQWLIHKPVIFVFRHIAIKNKSILQQQRRCVQQRHSINNWGFGSYRNDDKDPTIKE